MVMDVGYSLAEYPNHGILFADRVRSLLDILQKTGGAESLVAIVAGQVNDTAVAWIGMASSRSIRPGPNRFSRADGSNGTGRCS